MAEKNEILPTGLFYGGMAILGLGLLPGLQIFAGAVGAAIAIYYEEYQLRKGILIGGAMGALTVPLMIGSSFILFVIGAVAVGEGFIASLLQVPGGIVGLFYVLTVTVLAILLGVMEGTQWGWTWHLIKKGAPASTDD